MPFTVITLAWTWQSSAWSAWASTLRNFDMALVFKDLTRDVFRVDAIPTQSLDTDAGCAAAPCA